MKNLLVVAVISFFACFTGIAQEGIDCSAITLDTDGDYIIGVADLVTFLGVFGANFDQDSDGLLDCVDDCIGDYDECGICNGSGPQYAVIDSVIAVLDSTYDENAQNWFVFQTPVDTVYSLSCDSASDWLTNCVVLDSIMYQEDSIYVQTIDEWFVFDVPSDTIQILDCQEVPAPINCEDPILFDEYWYEVVQIGDQCWFAENLRTTVYENGDVIPAGLTIGEWTSTTTGATAVYGEGGSTCFHSSPDIDACDEAQSLAEYGRLYNWYAVDDARGLCPNGWHVPTDGEWTDLEDFITAQGFSGNEGTALKSTYGWSYGSYDGNGTDDFGFSALPGGSRTMLTGSSGYFIQAGSSGSWWSSSPDSGDAWFRWLYRNTLDIGRSIAIPGYGYSVRCLRDLE